MKCERCNINPATHHYKKNMNGKITEKYLCASCAAEENMPFKIFSSGVVFPPFLGTPSFAKGEEPIQARCPECGTTFSEFNETAFLGCSNCYSEMRHYLEPVIKKLHGSMQHTGKIPNMQKNSPQAGSKAAERAHTVRMLEKAIRDEEFEEAARLRDLIRTMDSEPGEGSV